MRPAAICFSHLFDNPAPADARGTLVTPFSGAPMAKFGGGGAPGSVIPTDILSNGDVKHRFQVTNLVKQVQFGCLPRGRYGINVVYPDGQAWSVPNEAGACSGSEGTTDFDRADVHDQAAPGALLAGQPGGRRGRRGHQPGQLRDAGSCRRNDDSTRTPSPRAPPLRRSPSTACRGARRSPAREATNAPR